MTICIRIFSWTQYVLNSIDIWLETYKKSAWSYDNAVVRHIATLFCLWVYWFDFNRRICIYPRTLDATCIPPLLLRSEDLIGMGCSLSLSQHLCRSFSKLCNFTHTSPIFFVSDSYERYNLKIHLKRKNKLLIYM